MAIAETMSDQLLDYCKEHSKENSSLLVELEKYTFANEDVPQMISGQLVGNFLQSIILMIRAKQIVEVGMFTGFSALKMAEVLPDDGSVHTCELMDKHVKTADLVPVRCITTFVVRRSRKFFLVIAELKIQTDYLLTGIGSFD